MALLNSGVGSGSGSGTEYTDGASAPVHPIGGIPVFNKAGVITAVSDTNPLPVNATVSISGVSTAVNQTSGGQKTQVVDGAGNVIGATANALDINIKSGNITGFATAAKQPALGTAGTASADVITVQGIASMTALKVDGSAVTQPISGTITANAGSGTFNNQQSNITADYDTGAGTQTMTMFGISLPASGGAVAGGTATNPIQVSLANTAANSTAVKVDGSAVTQPVSGTVTTSPPANASTNVAQLAGTATDTNSGVKSAGTLRVVLATDQPQLTNKLLVTPDANSAVNVAQINGVTTLMGNGATGTGSQRVTISNDNTGIANWGQGATGAAVPSGAQYHAGIAKTALPTAATDGNLTGIMTDKFGRQVTLTAAMRDLIGSQRTTISASTSETTIVTAAASIFNDIFLLTVRNTSATAVRVDIRDTTAGTIIDDIYVPAGETRGWNSGGIPVPQTSVNTNWTAQCSASVTDVRITAWFIKNK